MPVGVRTHGRGPSRRLRDKDVPANPRAHFEDHGNTRPSGTLPWGGRSATQEEVDRTRAEAMVDMRDRHSTQEWANEAAAQEQAIRENQRAFNERPPENRRRRTVNIQGQN